MIAGNQLVFRVRTHLANKLKKIKSIPARNKYNQMLSSHLKKIAKKSKYKCKNRVKSKQCQPRFLSSNSQLQPRNWMQSTSNWKQTPTQKFRTQDTTMWAWTSYPTHLKTNFLKISQNIALIIGKIKCIHLRPLESSRKLMDSKTKMKNKKTKIMNYRSLTITPPTTQLSKLRNSFSSSIKTLENINWN